MAGTGVWVAVLVTVLVGGTGVTVAVAVPHAESVKLIEPVAALPEPLQKYWV